MPAPPARRRLQPLSRAMTLAYPFVPVVRLTAEAICHPVLALRIILAGPVRNAVLLLVFNHLLDVETNMAKNPRSEL